MSKTSIKIDTMEIHRNRSGKADGYIPEVRRGTGMHTPKQFKKKYKNQWKKDVRNNY